MRHFVLYRYYGIIILKSQLLRRKGIVTIRSNIKGREPQLPTTLSSPVTKDNFMIIEFSENDKKNFNKFFLWSSPFIISFQKDHNKTSR